MTNELIINARSYETRVALVENGVVVELHIERDRSQELMGNIYQGKGSEGAPGYAGFLRGHQPGQNGFPLCCRYLHVIFQISSR